MGWGQALQSWPGCVECHSWGRLSSHAPLPPLSLRHMCSLRPGAQGSAVDAGRAPCPPPGVRTAAARELTAAPSPLPPSITAMGPLIAERPLGVLTPSSLMGGWCAANDGLTFLPATALGLLGSGKGRRS